MSPNVFARCKRSRRRHRRRRHRRRRRRYRRRRDRRIRLQRIGVDSRKLRATAAPPLAHNGDLLDAQRAVVIRPRSAVDRRATFRSTLILGSSMRGY